MLSTLKRTITKSTLYLVEGTTYLCALRRHIALGAHATSTAARTWALRIHWATTGRCVYIAQLYYCSLMCSASFDGTNTMIMDEDDFDVVLD